MFYALGFIIGSRAGNLEKEKSQYSQNWGGKTQITQREGQTVDRVMSDRTLVVA